MNLTRRNTLVLGAAAAATLASPHLARAAAPFVQPPLPYAEDALAPQLSQRTVALHYGKHHKGYFDKLNSLVPGTPYADMSLEEVVKSSKKNGDMKIFNQAGQASNHVSTGTSSRADRQVPTAPSRKLWTAISGAWTR